MFGILARLLEILYSIWPSYGGSIILFTIVIMLVLAPLTFKSTRSMLAMQALQPEVKKLQNRYKDDRQKLNEEMMKFYRENKISPLGGCLPMLIQFPVFIILYQLLYKLTERGPFGQDLGHSFACQLGGVNACVNKAYVDAGFFHPAYLKHTSQLYQDLSHTRVMDFLGIDLSQSAMSAFGQNLGHALPYVLMVLLVMGLTYLQQQQIQSRQPKNSQQNPTQQMMMKFMPIVMGFIYIIIPAGVVLYFLVSSVFRIGQQAMVTRTFYTGPNAISIPTTAVEEDEDVDDEPRERKSFWDQFKPPPDSMPQVGKKKGGGSGPPKKGKASATTGGAKSGNKSQTKPKKKPGQASGSSGAKKSGQKAGGRKNGSGNKSGSSTGSGRGSGAGNKAGAGNKKKSSAKRADQAPRGQDSSGRERTREAPSRQAPSRAAPSRKAPDRPGRKK